MQCLHSSAVVKPSHSHLRSSCRPSLVQCSSFSFANSERASKPTGRRNRYVEKKQEDQLRQIAQGLCNFNGKQLQAVAHLLTEEHLKQIRIGMDIPPTNQGRKRQVGLVMRLLRSDLDEPSLVKLLEAVGQASRHNLPYSDADLEQQLDVWMEGLMANDQAVLAQLFELLGEDRQQDLQQLRAWSRQLQQHAAQQQQQQSEHQQQQQPEQQDQQQGSFAAADDAGQPQGVLVTTAVQDPEVLQLIQELNQPQSQAGSKSKGKGGKSSAASAARRAIRRMLKPLALDRL